MPPCPSAPLRRRPAWPLLACAKDASRESADGTTIRSFLAELGRAGTAIRPSAAGRAGQQATLFPRRLDQVAATKAICAIVAVRERIGEVPCRLLRRVWLRDPRLALLPHRGLDLRLGRCRLRRYGLQQ